MLAGMLERGDGVPADAAKAEELRTRVLDQVVGAAALAFLADWCKRGGVDGLVRRDVAFEVRVRQRLRGRLVRRRARRAR